MVFERLFGAGGSVEDRQAALRERASLLDWVREDVARLKAKLGQGDRARVDGYLNSIREVEREIQRAESTAADNPLPDLDRPQGVPAAYADHARVMFDLQRLALQGDITRVITFQLARELSGRTYPEVGVPDPHHPLSHHGNDPEKVEKISRINRFHVSLFAEHLHKLRDTPDGDGSLLDHSVLLYGSGMGNPEHPRSRQPADSGRGRGLLRRARRAACQVRPGHSAGQPAPDAAGSRGRPHGFLRRQQREDR